MVVFFRRSTAVVVAVSNALYSWDLLPAYGYAQPGKVTSGAGTLGDPYSEAEGKAIGPAASGHRKVIWLPGDINITTTNGAGAKYPAFVPVSGASSTRMVIHQAQYPGSTNPSLYTRIRRTSGSGTIFGFYQSSYCVFDGFRCDTLTGVPQTAAGGGTGEAAQVGCWESTGCKVVRLWLDGQGDNYGSDGNRSVIHVEQCVDWEIGDSYITSTGVALTGAAPHNTPGIMIYDSSGGDIHHNTLYYLATAIWSKAQHIAASVYDIDIHHNRIDFVNGGIAVSNPIQTTLGNYVRVYQNIITRAQINLIIKSYGSGEPSGIAMVNNTVGNGYQHEVLGWQPVAFNTQSNTIGTGAFVDANLIVRNNAYTNVYAMNYLYDSGSQNDKLRWDYNGYSSYTQFAGDPEGASISQASWQASTPARDTNGLFSGTSPSFVDAPNADFRLQVGSAYRNAGTDYLNLLGGGTSAAINLGAYITSGMTDQIGQRI